MWFPSRVATWSFLTNHALVVSFIARNPDVRIRDLAVGLDVTERTAFAVVADLVESGYVVKEKTGRRNRYHIQAEQPLGGAVSAERTIGDLLDLLVEEETAAKERGAGGERRQRNRRADDPR
jgi:predicted transcriptional regulator